jgi:hypothetical protein
MAANPTDKLNTYGEFWPFYLAEHRRHGTRLLHYFGTLLGVVTLATAIATQVWWLVVAALVSGYLFAWIAHIWIERNRPATFTYPWWSFISDFRMCFLALTFRLRAELRRYNVIH